jgi:hypothetical protein
MILMHRGTACNLAAKEQSITHTALLSSDKYSLPGQVAGLLGRLVFFVMNIAEQSQQQSHKT